MTIDGDRHVLTPSAPTSASSAFDRDFDRLNLRFLPLDDAVGGSGGGVVTYLAATVR